MEKNADHIIPPIFSTLVRQWHALSLYHIIKELRCKEIQGFMHYFCRICHLPISFLVLSFSDNISYVYNSWHPLSPHPESEPSPLHGLCELERNKVSLHFSLAHHWTWPLPVYNLLWLSLGSILTKQEMFRGLTATRADSVCRNTDFHSAFVFLPPWQSGENSRQLKCHIFDCDIYLLFNVECVVTEEHKDC